MLEVSRMETGGTPMLHCIQIEMALNIWNMVPTKLNNTSDLSESGNQSNDSKSTAQT